MFQSGNEFKCVVYHKDCLFSHLAFSRLPVSAVARAPLFLRQASREWAEPLFVVITIALPPIIWC